MIYNRINDQRKDEKKESKKVRNKNPLKTKWERSMLTQLEKETKTKNMYKEEKNCTQYNYIE